MTSDPFCGTNYLLIITVYVFDLVPFRVFDKTKTLRTRKTYTHFFSSIHLEGLRDRIVIPVRNPDLPIIFLSLKKKKPESIPSLFFCKRTTLEYLGRRAEILSILTGTRETPDQEKSRQGKRPSYQRRGIFVTNFHRTHRFVRALFPSRVFFLTPYTLGNGSIIKIRSNRKIPSDRFRL